MNRRTAVFVGLALALAMLFVRLGFWQVRRLRERRAHNANLAMRLAAPVVPFGGLRDTTAFRHATVSGTADYANEIVWTGRSRNGSPGVYILTPVRRAANDTAVLVLRGWVYAPDAATVDLSRWREPRDSFTGYVIALPVAQRTAGAAPSVSGRKLRTLTFGGTRSLLPYPVASLYLVSQDSAGNAAPARLAAPVLDDGPHLSYAIQWFSFATIAIVGALIVTLRTRARGDNLAPLLRSEPEVRIHS